MGNFSPYLIRSGQGYIINSNEDKHKEFMRLIPLSTDDITVEQMLIITSALRASRQKVRVELFRQKKGKVICVTWLNYCLDNLGDGTSTEINNLLLEILKFVTVLRDTIRNNSDLEKARARYEVDLVEQMRRTKAAVMNVNGLIEIKEELRTVEYNFFEIYNVVIDNGEDRGWGRHAPADVAEEVEVNVPRNGVWGPINREIAPYPDLRLLLEGARRGDGREYPSVENESGHMIGDYVVTKEYYQPYHPFRRQSRRYREGYGYVVGTTACFVWVAMLPLANPIDPRNTQKIGNKKIIRRERM